jgi:SAM-dependent methyltransferase
MNKYSKKTLEAIFYKNVPKARKINPFFREQFELVYEASILANEDAKVLNIYSSNDLSKERENIYSAFFFANTSYYIIDFWRDHFVDDDTSAAQNYDSGNPYHINYPDNYFDVIITTKVIMEHVSRPSLVLNEVFRVLKTGGSAFVIAPHIRRQHQPPHDYYRFTEYALNHIFKASGFSTIDIRHTGGFMAVVGYYLYFFQRGLRIPQVVEKTLDLLHYYILEPIFYYLDSLDNGHGRDMTLYFMVRARK